MAVGAFLVVILVLGAVITAVIIAVQRLTKDKSDSSPSDGNDVVAYLVMALAMIVTGFALARLAESAFPSTSIVLDPARDLAASLPALIVAAPFVVFFWRRQAKRREIYPHSVGWGVYLALIELVFGIAFVTTAVIFLNGVFGDETVMWTSVVVYGGIVLFHELAAHRTPPATDAGELYRVIGAAIGLITMTVGLVMTLGLGVLTTLQDAIAPDPLLEVQWQPWVAMLLVGAPIWVYRWFQPWRDEAGLPRNTWLVVATVGSFVMTVVGGTGALVLIAEDLFAGEDFGGRFPQFLPIFIALFIVGGALFLVHRRRMGTERTNLVRSYESAVAASSLITAIVAGVALVNISFSQDTIVGNDTSDVIEAGFILVSAVTVWIWAHSRANKGDAAVEATAWPRRLYLLGMGAVAGITSAISLIITLVVLVRRTIDGVEGGSLLVPSTLFVISGLAAWYLLALYFKGQQYLAAKETVAPFDVTIVCAHPGTVSTLLPEQARVRVIHRGDGIGVITEDLAAEIVERVGHESTLVWVDDEGVRVAPAR